MACTRMVLCLLLAITMAYCANGGISMDEICKKHKDGGRCENPRIKLQCASQCGGGGGDQQTQQPQSQTQAPNHNNGNGNGNGKHCDKRSPCVSLDQANGAFRGRCEATNGALKETCYSHCRYDQDTPTLKKAFLGGPCPLSQLRVFLTAASGNRDNTACCQEQGVLSQKKTGVCGCFCYPTGPVWPQKGETAKYAPCVGVLTGIMNCHYYAEGTD